MGLPGLTDDGLGPRWVWGNKAGERRGTRGETEGGLVDHGDDLPAEGPASSVGGDDIEQAARLERWKGRRGLYLRYAFSARDSLIGFSTVVPQKGVNNNFRHDPLAVCHRRVRHPHRRLLLLLLLFSRSRLHVAFLRRTPYLFPLPLSSLQD